MGRSPCCEKVGLKKGPWTPEEDQKLLAYIEEHGHGSWRALPGKAGLERCGKSCRLRWTNYLRPDIKRGKFSLQEEQTIIQLHALLGNRWSAIATHLPKRTDNEIKNYWNTHLKKRLAKMGIDPVTHKAKSDALSSVDGESKNTASLSHMAQWESARLEAEARLVKESKLRSLSIQHQLGVPAASAQASTSSHSKAAAPPASSLSLDVLKAWQEVWSKSTNSGPFSGVGGGGGADLESPTSTLKFSEKPQLITSSTTAGFCYDSTAFEGEINGEGEGDWKSFERSSSNLPTLKDRTDNATIFTTAGLHDAVFGGDGQWTSESLTTGQEPDSNFLHGFGDLILGKSGDRNSSEGVGDSDNGDGSHLDDLEESRIYWSDILNLVNSSPSDAPVF